MTKYKLTPLQVLRLRQMYTITKTPSDMQIKIAQIIGVEREEEADVYSQSLLSSEEPTPFCGVVIGKRYSFMPNGEVHVNDVRELLPCQDHS